MYASLPSQADIVIVGAGPAGLAAALSLVHRGISACGIPFVEPRNGRPVGAHTHSPAARLFVLADVEFEEPLPPYVSRDEALIMLTAQGPFVFMPLNDPRAPGHTVFRRVVDAYGPGSHRADGLPTPKVKSLAESSRHSVVSALAGAFYARGHGAHVLLVGGTGHGHSPAGGQGINLSICDGVRAGTAVAEHVAAGPGEASYKVLQQYGARGRAVAVSVIRVSETLDSVQFVKNAWHATVRGHAMWFLLSILPLNSRFVQTMSGIRQGWGQFR
ncbi:hypothetical protein AURDEDRAFT_173399 [Auricularia subglabra TFB-10046 SS5]|uniref:FAD-binding domain-containing protein n=1 Tax=Auricularia subglabra (strain TFB-10046 / SS5) TaxID=717982 RepID=J0LHI2_AURST|nr:hypothetical protein AURDEDRAFT_173399 [Auricularia subglabra TFB-10046 SS5]